MRTPRRGAVPCLHAIKRARRAVRFDSIVRVRGMAVLAVVLATSACDLVFPPAKLAADGGASVDGPAPGDGPPGSADGPIDGFQASDGPGQLPDAETCAPLTCLGNNAVSGQTGCAPQATQWCG